MNQDLTESVVRIASAIDSPDFRFLEAVDLPLLVFDWTTGEIVGANGEAAQLFGTTTDALRSRSVEDISPETDAHSRNRARELLKHAVHDPPLSIEWKASDLAGTEFWIKTSLAPIESLEDEFVLALVTERTDPDEQERRLETFKTIVEHAGHGIYWTDVNGTIKYVNPAFEKITGYTADEILGRTPGILKSGEMDDTYYEDLWETILGGETFETEVINQRKSGERFVIKQTIAPVTDENGVIQRFVAVNSEITDRKRREQRLEAERERVEQLTERLSVLNRILRHDIRSSINIIRGNADLVDSSPDFLEGAIETISKEADRLERISESVRHIESVTAESGSTVEQIDLSTLVRTKIMRYRNEYPETRFQTTLAEGVTVQASNRIDLALDHLVSNAIVHNNNDTPTVEITVGETGDFGYVEITDNGPGIPDAELEPLEEGRETPLEHASGMGLWLTNWIVEASNGQLRFREAGSTGTTVAIELQRP